MPLKEAHNFELLHQIATVIVGVSEAIHEMMSEKTQADEHIVWTRDLTFLLCHIIIAEADGHPDGVNISSLAARSGIPRTTVRRKVEDLVNRGYVTSVDGELTVNHVLFNREEEKHLTDKIANRYIQHAEKLKMIRKRRVG
jgi:DNA-binding MarR family transcriptional regulator